MENLHIKNLVSLMVNIYMKKIDGNLSKIVLEKVIFLLVNLINLQIVL